MKSFPGHIIFPIKSDTACLLKWSWSTINMQEGHTSSCHRVHSNPIDPDNFDNFHNLVEKVQARNLMLQGEWPGHGCEYCATIESSGGTSDRQLSLMQSHTIDKIPPELLKDPTAVEVTPTILEVYFDNTCNMSCVYCDPQVSSKLNDEISRHGEIQIGSKKMVPFKKNHLRYQDLTNKLWQYLENSNRYQTIRHYNMLGGEPFLQKELDQGLEFWKHHPNPSLTFNLVSNLMIPHETFKQKMVKFQQLVESNAIYTVEITASMDCWGEQQEYVRYGLDLENVWIKNFEYLLDKEWVHVAIHSCISSLTIKTMPALLDKINHWNTKTAQAIDHSFDLVIGDVWKEAAMHPILFAPDVFEKDLETILSLMPQSTASQQASRSHMQGIATYLNTSQQDLEKIKNLQNYLTELDCRRGTNWKLLFPWLVNI